MRAHRPPPALRPLLALVPGWLLFVASVGAAGAPTGTGGSHAAPLSAPEGPRATLGGTPRAAADRGSAVAVPSWRNVTAESSEPLPIDWFTEGTWDTADGYLLTYGGDNFVGSISNETWTYSGGQWSQATTTGSPGPLDGPALAYDPAANEVVMYGGLTSYSPFNYTNTTWTYSGGSWTGAQLDPTPPPRLSGGMTYDPDLGGVVLFGGYNNSDPSGGSLLNDLWLYKAGAWSRLPDGHAPSPRTWVSLAYDPLLPGLVLYSGLSASSNCLGGTWTYDGGNWTELAGSVPEPPVTCANSVAYDPDLGAVVVTGGFSSSTGYSSNTTWAFNGTGWTNLTGGFAPTEHVYGVTAWDPVDRSLVVAGGASQFSATDVLSEPLSVANLTGPLRAEAGEPVTFDAQAAGGVPVRSYNWAWGDGTSGPGGANASHTFASAGRFVVEVRVADADNGTASANLTVTIAEGPTVAIDASSTVADVGVPVNFSAQPISGAGGEVYNWTFGDGELGAGPSLAHTYGAVGNYTVELRFVDADGVSGSTEATEAIVAAPSVQLDRISMAEVGVAIAFNATVSGGVRPLTYLWTFGDGGVATSPAPDHTFTSTGQRLVNLTVRDQSNDTVSAVQVVTVVAALGAVIQGPTSVAPGGPGTWTVALTGGEAPYAVTWSFPSGPMSTGDSANHSFAGGGTYAIDATVRDALGGVAEARINVSVNAGSNSPFGGTFGGVPTVALGAGAVLLVAVAVGAILWMRRGRSPPGAP